MKLTFRETVVLFYQVIQWAKRKLHVMQSSMIPQNFWALQDASLFIFWVVVGKWKEYTSSASRNGQTFTHEGT
jgi:hypothetical protein